MKEVDAITEVPEDIYWSLLVAAQDADIGQHKLVKGPGGALRLKLSSHRMTLKEMGNSREETTRAWQKSTSKSTRRRNSEREEMCMMFCVPLPRRLAPLAYMALLARKAIQGPRYDLVEQGVEQAARHAVDVGLFVSSAAASRIGNTLTVALY